MAGNSVIGALRVNLGLDSAQFQSGLKAAQSGLGRFGSVAKTSMVAVAAAAVAATAAIALGVRGVLNEADELNKASQKIGVPVEELSKLKYAADLSDVSFGSLTNSLKKLEVGMVASANGGMSGAAGALDDMGIAVKNADGTMRGASEVFSDISAKFAGMKDGAEKTAMAVTIFGKSGTDMIPLLNAGADGLAKMKAEAESLGIVIDGKTAQAAENFNDNLTRLHGAMSGFLVQITAALAPTLEKISSFLVDLAKSFSALSPTVQSSTAIFVGLAVVITPLVVTIGLFASGIAAISAPVALAIAGLIAIGTAFVVFGDQISVAATAMSGFLSGAWASFEQAWNTISQTIRDATAAMIATVVAFGGKMVQVFVDLKDKVIAAVADMVNQIGVWLGEKMDAIIAKLSNIGERITAPFREAWDAVVGHSWIPDLVLGVEDWMGRLAVSAPKLAQTAAGGISAEMQDVVNLGQTIGSSLASAIPDLIKHTKSVKDVFADLASSVLQSWLKVAQSDFSSVLSGIGGTGGGGGFLGSLASSLFDGLKFASGGSIMPGGTGGIDSQLVQFRKSPNERVDITKPGQSLSGTSAITLHIVGEEGPMFRPTIRSESKGVAVEVTQAGIKNYDSGLAVRVGDVLERHG